MIKYYCDKCGKELAKDERYRCDLKISGFSAVTDRYDTDYCEDCLSSIIGKEKFADLIRRKEERKRRIEERKQQDQPTEKGGGEE